MATVAKWAHGSILTADSEVVAELMNIGTPSLDRDEEDVTNHQSSEGYEEMIMTLKRTGTIPISGNYVAGDDGQAKLLELYNAGTLAAMTIDLPNNLAQWSFNAYVKSIHPLGELANGKVAFSAVLRPSGECTLTETVSGGLTALAGVNSAAGDLTFVPGFATGVYTYTVAVATAITYIKLTPTAASHTITVNGAVVGTGVESGEIALGAADSVTTVTIVAQEANKAPKTYTIYVARAAA